MALNKQTKSKNEPLEMVGKYKTGEFVVSQNKPDKKEVNWKDYYSAVFDPYMVSGTIVGNSSYGISSSIRGIRPSPSVTGTISSAVFDESTATGATLTEETLNDFYRWVTRESRGRDEAPHAQQENRRR